MVKEDYVSYETAKLLKEKRFDGMCLSMYLTQNRTVEWGILKSQK